MVDPPPVFSVSSQPKCDGQTLLTQVWERLNLIECDYFGLESQNAQSCWVRVTVWFWKAALHELRDAAGGAPGPVPQDLLARCGRARCDPQTAPLKRPLYSHKGAPPAQVTKASGTHLL